MQLSQSDQQRIREGSSPSILHPSSQDQIDNADLVRKGKGVGTADLYVFSAPEPGFLGMTVTTCGVKPVLGADPSTHDRGLSPDTLGIASNCAAASADLNLA